MVTVLKKRIDYKHKTKAERRELKSRSMNLTVPFTDVVIVHFGADNINPVIQPLLQPTTQEKRNRKYGSKK